MLIWAIILGALIIGFELEEDDETALLVIFPAMGVIIISFVPYFNITIGKIYKFKGTGTPISEDELRKKILELNDYDVPVMTLKKRKKLIVTWKYVDAKWWEILAKAGLTSVYELHIKFKPKKSLTTLIDVHKKVQWRAGPKEVKFRGGYFRGVMFYYEISKQWGLDENFKFRKIFDYKFRPSEIKNPVMNTILRSGWNVRFRIW
jgi:hypothetical protein